MMNWVSFAFVYCKNIEFEMPDKYHLTYMEEGILENFLNRVNNSEIDATLFAIIRVLTKLATKSKNYFNYYFL